MTIFWTFCALFLGVRLLFLLQKKWDEESRLDKIDKKSKKELSEIRTRQSYVSGQLDEKDDVVNIGVVDKLGRPTNKAGGNMLRERSLNSTTGVGSVANNTKLSRTF